MSTKYQRKLMAREYMKFYSSRDCFVLFAQAFMLFLNVKPSARSLHRRNKFIDNSAVL